MRRPLALLSALLLLACDPPPPPVPGTMPPGGTPLVTVNGNVITEEMRDAMVKQIPESVKKQMEASGQLGQIQEQLVVSDLLYREALNRKLNEDQDTAILVAMASRTALADAALKQMVEARITDESLKAAYDERLVRYKKPQVHARVMAVASEEAANALKAQLDGGADFAELAKANSLDQSTSSTGGDLGWVSQKDINPTFGGPLFTGAAGDVVGPLGTQGGWLLFKVEERRDTTPFEDVKDEIKTDLQQEMARKVVDELKSAATIVQGGGGATVTPPAPDAVTPPAPAPAGEAH